MRVRVQGLRELDAALMELTKAGARGVLRRAGLAALQPVADAAQAAAPRLSGALQLSVGVGTKLTRRQAGLHRKMVRDDKASVEVFAGAGGLAQATQMEFGNFKDAAQPYLRPAWDAGRMQVIENLKRHLGAEIDKAAVRAARKAMRAARKAGG